MRPSTLRRRSTCIALLWGSSLLACAAQAQSALNSSDALVVKRETQAWLQRIQEAANRRNYHGTVVLSAGGTVASSRISHLGDGRHPLERIDALDGQPRQVVRQNEQIHTVWPERRVATVEPREPMNSFPGLIQPGSERITDFYELKPAGQERVAGREATVLALQSRDSHRYGYRLWADKSSGLLLRTEVISESGAVLESSAFSEVSIGTREPLESILQPIRRLEGYRVKHARPETTHLEAEGWSLKPNVPGFRLVSCTKRPADSPLRAALDEPVRLQAVYSDGITSISLFIEPYVAARHVRPMHAAIGATQTLMHRQGDWWVTLMGDVPGATLTRFADSLERTR